MSISAKGIFSTVENQFLWDQALYSHILLPKKYLHLIFKKHIPAWGQSYGYGWIICEMHIGNTKEKIRTREYSGDVNGYKSLILKISILMKMKYFFWA